MPETPLPPWDGRPTKEAARDAQLVLARLASLADGPDAAALHARVRAFLAVCVRRLPYAATLTAMKVRKAAKRRTPA